MVCIRHCGVVVTCRHCAVCSQKKNICRVTVVSMELGCLTYAECKAFVPQFSRAKCVRVYDGDTVHMGVYMDGYGATRFTCRLLGIDTPELRSKNKGEKTLAKIAREEVKSHILNRVVDVTINGVDKYGRLLTRVRTSIVPDISTHLINQGLAVTYDGGRKRKIDWDELLRNWLAKNADRSAPLPDDDEEEEEEV